MEQEQSSVEQWSKILLQLETLRTELHGMVDAHIDALRYQMLTGELPEQQLRTRPLRADPYAFKGEKPESIQLPDGREVKTPTWKTAVLAILQDCNAEPDMHARLMELRGKIMGRQRTILAASPEGMHAPLEIDKNLYMESYYDTASLLYVLKERVLDAVGYDYSGICVRLQPEQKREPAFGMDEMTL